MGKMSANDLIEQLGAERVGSDLIAHVKGKNVSLGRYVEDALVMSLAGEALRIEYGVGEGEATVDRPEAKPEDRHVSKTKTHK